MNYFWSPHKVGNGVYCARADSTIAIIKSDMLYNHKLHVYLLISTYQLLPYYVKNIHTKYVFNYL